MGQLHFLAANCTRLCGSRGASRRSYQSTASHVLRPHLVAQHRLVVHEDARRVVGPRGFQRRPLLLDIPDRLQDGPVMLFALVHHRAHPRIGLPRSLAGLTRLVTAHGWRRRGRRIDFRRGQGAGGDLQARTSRARTWWWVLGDEGIDHTNCCFETTRTKYKRASLSRCVALTWDGTKKMTGADV